jgi:hypothetical protein
MATDFTRNRQIMAVTLFAEDSPGEKGNGNVADVDLPAKRYFGILGEPVESLVGRALRNSRSGTKAPRKRCEEMKESKEILYLVRVFLLAHRQNPSRLSAIRWDSVSKVLK